jgi:ketosteroid isomerase-like protein
MSKATNEIINVLEKFQHGYKLRDLSQVSSFFNELFVTDSDSMIVGTGQEEWIVGLEKIKELLENDWKEWSDLTIDIENAHIHEAGNVAWVTTKASCAITYTIDQIMEYIKEMLKSTLNDPDQSNIEKFSWINTISSRVLFEKTQGDTLKYALRISIVMVKRENRWKIHQMHFSFPNVLFPDGRIKE